MKERSKIIEIENKNLKNEKECLKEIINIQQLKIIRLEIKFHDLLSNFFSKTQIEMILKKKTNVYKWNEHDIASAITLRSLSPKAYRF